MIFTGRPASGKEIQMPEDPVSEARTRIHDRFGADLANKASASFCLAFGRPVAEPAFGFEAVEPLQPAATVIEFKPEEEKVSRTWQAAEAVRRGEAWGRVREALKGMEESAVMLVPGQLLRQAKVRTLRDDFYRSAGPVCDEIERSSRGMFRPGPEATASPRTPSAVTELCWLNRTVRTWTDPRVLAEVAAAPDITTIDLPRRLEPDIRVTGNTVGARLFRERRTRSGRGIVIAIIDSEVALRHPAFQDRVIHKQNYSLELWGNPGAHGTAVAGIAAANDANFLGMAPEATIYNYKVLATNRFLNADDFGGALAIQQALEDGAHIANCSWGVGPARDGTSREARACNAAWALGLTIVKSAGNNGPGARTLTTPADADGVIVVGATDREGTAIQDFSSRGPTGHQPGRERPHLLAPGGTPVRGIDSCLPQGGFGDCGHGTSFAAPHISGLLALILEGDPDLTPDELRDLLVSRCTRFQGADGNIQGAGLISVAEL